MPKPDVTLRARTDRDTISYGPSREGDDSAWMLAWVTPDGERVELHLTEEQMYTLWTEVKNTPWPNARRNDPKDTLRTIVAEVAGALDEGEVYDILERGLER